MPSQARIHLNIDGAWSDITGDVRAENGRVALINRGQRAEADTVDPSKCDLVIHNRYVSPGSPSLGRKYAPRNPHSPLYGKIGRNTPIRATVTETVDTGPTFDAYSTPTPSSGTGDVSWVHTPRGVPKGVLVLPVQFVGATDEVISVTYGGVTMTEVALSPLLMSAGIEDGAVYGYFLGSNVPPGPQVVSVDVNATGSLHVFVCITIVADSATTVVEDTSTFTSTGTATPSVTLTTAVKTFIAAGLVTGSNNPPLVTTAGYEGITGTTGSEAYAQVWSTGEIAAGSPSVAFDTNISEEAAILGVAVKNGPDIVRFAGEVTAWPQGAGTAGIDAWVPIQAAGILRRLGQGASPLKSAPRRYIPTTSPKAYWPLDDGPLASWGQPLVGSGRFNRVTTADPPVKFGNTQIASWLEPTLEIPSAVDFVATLTPGSFIDGQWAVDYMFGGEDVGTMVFRVRTPGLFWRFTMDPATEDVAVVFEVVGTSTTNLGPFSIPELFDGSPHHVRFRNDDSGADINYVFLVDGVSRFSGTRTSVAIQAPTSIGFGYIPASDDSAWVLGHVAVWVDTLGAAVTIPDVTVAANASLGFVGEAAGRRIERLCRENDVPFQPVGDLDDTAMLGPQHQDTLLEILREAAFTDGGILFEPRSFTGLAYRPRISLYNQAVVASFTYGTGAFAETPVPVDDDTYTRNDVTVTRRDGSSYQAELDTGALSTQPPPDGVGRYDENVTVNVETDDDLPDQAGWRLHVGTVNEERYPDVALHSTAASALDVGDRLTIHSLPGKPANDQIDQLAVGFTEELHRTRRQFLIHCIPESSYRVGVWDDTASRYSPDGSTVNEDLTTTETDVDVATPSGPLWSHADGDFDIIVGGERMTVTAVTGSSSPQTFTVVRSVNQVVKVHSTGAAVELFRPAVYAL